MGILRWRSKVKSEIVMITVGEKKEGGGGDFMLTYILDLGANCFSVIFSLTLKVLLFAI